MGTHLQAIVDAQAEWHAAVEAMFQQAEPNAYSDGNETSAFAAYVEAIEAAIEAKVSLPPLYAAIARQYITG